MQRGSQKAGADLAGEGLLNRIGPGFALYSRGSNLADSRLYVDDVGLYLD